MTVRAAVLIQAKAAEDSLTTQYVAANAQALIDKFTATNYSGATVTLTVHLVATGGSPGDINAVLRTKALLAGETYLCPEVVGHVLNPGNFISTLASAPGSIAIRASGREVS